MHINYELINALKTIPEDNSDVYFKQYLDYLLIFLKKRKGKQQNINEFYIAHMTPRSDMLNEDDDQEVVKSFIPLPFPKFI